MALLLCTVLMSVLSSASALREQRPPPVLPRVGAGSSGVYRNMFAEAGYSQVIMATAWAAVLTGSIVPA